MNRKQLYDEIASLGLKDEIKRKCGRNYTQCSNDELQRIVTNAKKALVQTTIATTKPSRPAEPKCKCASTGTSSLEKLVNVLAKKRILLKSEVEEILG